MAFVRAQQNLVPNGSFENISACPTYSIYSSTLPFANSWQNPSNGTPDLFSVCDTTIAPGGWNRPTNGVPSNGWGFQSATKGSNYTGFLAYFKPDNWQNNLREYLQAQLLDSLKTNSKYCLTYYVSLADSLSKFATSRIGCCISSGAITNFSQGLISVSPQVSNPFGNFISNYVNWTQIQNIYIPSTNSENFITIGNFFNDTLTDTISVFNDYRHNASQRSYYYVDDVSLVEYNNAFAGTDTNICIGIKINRHLISTYAAQFNWTVLNGDVNSIDSNLSASPTFNPTVTTTYVLQKQQCGINTYDTLLIRVPALYPAKVGNDTTICIGDTIILSALNNCTWCNHSWNGGANSTQVSVRPLTTSNYQFSQTDSCRTTTDEVKVNVEYCKSPVLTSPNIFTPNGDGINEIWLPLIQNELSLTNYSLTIFDRWGLKIFETSKTKDGWDGHSTSGTECNEGTYYFIIDYTDIKTNEKKSQKGFLQLMR